MGEKVIHGTTTLPTANQAVPVILTLPLSIPGFHSPDRRKIRIYKLYNAMAMVVHRTCYSKTSLFAVYISYVAYNMHGIMNPMRNVVIEPGTPTIKPLWSEGTKA